GTRCPDVEPSTTPVRGGPAMLAKPTKATIVPIGIYTKDYRIKLFRKVYVTVGTPKKFEELGFMGMREDYDRVTNEIFSDICKLCDAAKEKANAKRR
ncbi:MAG: hypothetical protein IJW06_01555, partial [Clostridia bacterium]|nr:hypothetical protein [Clostridia bacterium]